MSDGKATGREHVRPSFLMTRQLREHLSIPVHLTA
jgi:hypothetical protein